MPWFLPLQRVGSASVLELGWWESPKCFQTSVQVLTHCEVPNKNSATIKQFFEQHIQSGTTIFTDRAKGPLLAPHPQTPSVCSCLPCVVQNFCCSRLPGRRPERQSCQPRNRKPTFRDDQKDKPVSKEVESRSVGPS